MTADHAFHVTEGTDLVYGYWLDLGRAGWRFVGAPGISERCYIDHARALHEYRVGDVRFVNQAVTA